MFSIKLENEFGNTKTIHDGEYYLVVDMTGLTPPPANQYTSKSHNRHGVKYNGYSLDERTVTISIKLLGDVELNRNILYDWIESGQYVKLHYSNGIRNVYCEGYVAVADAGLFTDDEIVELEITCPDPYFKSLETIVTEVTNLVPSFYLTEEDNDIYFATTDEGVAFSEETDSNLTTIQNNGSETGIVITAVMLEDVKNFKIYNGNNPSAEYIELKPTETLLKGDKLVIDTSGNRYKITVNGKNALSKFNRNITWFTLSKGSNSFYYEADNTNNVQLTIEYNERYLGV